MEKEEKKMVYLFFFLILAIVSSFCTASSVLSQKFYFRTSAYVTGYAEKWKTTTATQCAAQCLQKSTCDSYTYSRSTRDCYIQAETRQPEEGDDSSAHVKLYSTVSWCDKDTATVNTTTTTVNWHPSGLEGDLVCNNDYLYCGNNPTIVCNASGHWLADDTCKQKIWRNLQTTTICEVPAVLSPGWTMCARGVTCTACYGIRLDLTVASSGEVLVHLAIRFPSYTRAVFNSYLGGRWRQQYVRHISPTALYNQPFSVEFRLLSATQIQIFYNGADLIIYNAPVSIISADSITFQQEAGSDTVIQALDSWAGC